MSYSYPFNQQYALPAGVPNLGAPQYVYFPQQQYMPNSFLMPPTVVQNWNPAYAQQSGISPQWTSALLGGLGGGLGSAVGGPVGAGLGAAAGPLLYTLFTPEQEDLGQTLATAGTAGLGGFFGSSVAGPLGGALGGAGGGYLGYQLSNRF